MAGTSDHQNVCIVNTCTGGAIPQRSGVPPNLKFESRASCMNTSGNVISCHNASTNTASTNHRSDSPLHVECTAWREKLRQMSESLHHQSSAALTRSMEALSDKLRVECDEWNEKLREMAQNLQPQPTTVLIDDQNSSCLSEVSEVGSAAINIRRLNGWNVTSWSSPVTQQLEATSTSDVPCAFTPGGEHLNIGLGASAASSASSVVATAQGVLNLPQPRGLDLSSLNLKLGPSAFAESNTGPAPLSQVMTQVSGGLSPVCSSSTGSNPARLPGHSLQSSSASRFAVPPLDFGRLRDDHEKLPMTPSQATPSTILAPTEMSFQTASPVSVGSSEPSLDNRSRFLQSVRNVRARTASPVASHSVVRSASRARTPSPVKSHSVVRSPPQTPSQLRVGQERVLTPGELDRPKSPLHSVQQPRLLTPDRLQRSKIPKATIDVGMRCCSATLAAEADCSGSQEGPIAVAPMMQGFRSLWLQRPPRIPKGKENKKSSDKDAQVQPALLLRPGVVWKR
eukprot:gnl/MRDRNA2_/MRDRNA2_19729_c0_seq1.p1 gnl/MRDRNA2_/MRDRNA2_19729_c0~~gnl/MRDRNA2_/MRDRNA2_19729_c0_seq1.p1  ORF type:complete len:576 (-),score=55.18 gnl/MRDRNA2_/MRDRNA2_19729_c0_seq1:93-1625(-)